MTGTFIKTGKPYLAASANAVVALIKNGRAMTAHDIAFAMGTKDKKAIYNLATQGFARRDGTDPVTGKALYSITKSGLKWLKSQKLVNGATTGFTAIPTIPTNGTDLMEKLNSLADKQLDIAGDIEDLKTLVPATFGDIVAKAKRWDAVEAVLSAGLSQ